MEKFGNIIEQAQQLQGKIKQLEADIEKVEAEGLSGGGTVRVTLSGKNNMKNINIDSSLLKGNDKEILEDLIIAAYNDAKDKLKKLTDKKMEELTGGLPVSLSDIGLNL